MSKRAELAQILKTEYGIGSVAELEKAIAKIGGIDISLFCAEIKTARRDPDEKEQKKKPKAQMRPEMPVPDLDAYCYGVRAGYSNR